MDYKFKVEFLEPVIEFLESLDQKSKEKILYNIWKSRTVNDKELFKKLDREIWEFRTLYNKQYLRLFAFWDRSDKQDTIVISTHGIIKKTDKTPKVEIEKAESLRIKYFNEKK
ncbi:Phage-related protein [Flavobacterium micromati]|uniref:Phage-related protein n=1 Tax=Flavobacterium micromati TaxID=229205 RepID=A0A1M5Q0K2_9FLAO|nr:type II toxin-antitoxin system RelE/ParE family toxin [Flavobacterium micromati]SHH07301.1 Phage-related protein [Flavobacterium micromati]